METNKSGANECLLQDTEINKQKLMDAIGNNDVKTARQLIKEGMNINFILDRCTPLHAALQLKSMDMLEVLLSHPNIDLNIRDEQLAAPLILLLDCLCLHSECSYCTTVIHKLLNQGADVNVFCALYSTPLHRVIKSENLELVCMLLYYNADLSIKWKGHKPFSYAVHLSQYEIAEVLLNYYDDASYIIDSTEECISFLKCTNGELFQAVWPRVDPEVILSLEPTFIDRHLECWALSDWVECLYSILSSDIALDLIEDYRLNTRDHDSFLKKLLKLMYSRHVQSKDWIGLIYMALRSGVEVTIDDINSIAIYGLNQDLEPFICGTTYNCITDGSKFIYPLHAFVFGMETDYSNKKIYQLLHDASEEWNPKYCVWTEPVLPEIFAKTVAFFSFTADVKNSIMSLKNPEGCVIIDEKRLQKIPEFPSLMELSRNQLHKYLIQKFRFKQPYQLHDYVKKFSIPNRINDIILFKAPIY